MSTMIDIKETGPIVLLAPEAIKLWAIYPAILSTNSCAIMDLKDYDESQIDASRSRYHKLVANNLRILREEGFLLPMPYSQLLTQDVRREIFALGNDVEIAVSDKVGTELLISAYNSYRDSILLKTGLISDNMDLIVRHHRLLKMLDGQISLLNTAKDGLARGSKSNVNCLRQYFWKSLATISLASRIRQLTGAPSVSFYDSPEYGDFASVLVSMSPAVRIKHSPVSFEGKRVDFFRNVTKKLLTLAVPEYRAVSEADLMVFIRNRADFSELRTLICRMEELLDNTDERYAEEVMSRDLKRVLALIRAEMSRLRKSRFRLWIPVDFLNSGFGRAKELFGQDDQLFSEACDSLKGVLSDSDRWVFALLKLCSHETLLDIQNRLGKTVSEEPHSDYDEHWWITGNHQPPWYTSWK